MESKGEDKSNFRGKGTLAPEFQLGFCTNLKDDTGRGQEYFATESPIATLLHNMTGDDPIGIYPSRVDFRDLRSSAGRQALPIGCMSVSTA